MIAALILAVLTTPPPQHLTSITVDAPRAVLHLQVARTESERELGLMSVTELPPHTGMLFVFDRDAEREFWMKDTLVPLDMVFLGARGRVRAVFPNVPVVPLNTPDDRIPRRDADAKYVIELPAGEAAQDGIVDGVRLPEIPAKSRDVPSDSPLACSVPLLDPHQAVESSLYISHGSAQSDVDVTGPFHRTFGVEATFTLPAQPLNRGVFYSNSIMLLPLHADSFVQLELMRWIRYDYREEIGVTWLLPSGQLVYRDTGIFVSNEPHRLAIEQRGERLRLIVDGSTICSAPAARFFSPQQVLYYQLATEVERPGDRPSGTLSNIEAFHGPLGRYQPAQPRCVYRGQGLSWHDEGAGRFLATGSYDPAKPYLRFTGLRGGTACRA
jgi:uncharacterized membrane protein (UPF0127 family)